MQSFEERSQLIKNIKIIGFSNYMREPMNCEEKLITLERVVELMDKFCVSWHIFGSELICTCLKYVTFIVY
jgi:hypothetical protein